MSAVGRESSIISRNVQLFRFSSGKMRAYCDASSGKGAAKAAGFCGKCGTGCCNEPIFVVQWLKIGGVGAGGAAGSRGAFKKILFLP